MAGKEVDPSAREEEGPIGVYSKKEDVNSIGCSTGYAHLSLSYRSILTMASCEKGISVNMSTSAYAHAYVYLSTRKRFINEIPQEPYERPELGLLRPVEVAKCVIVKSFNQKSQPLEIEGEAYPSKRLSKDLSQIFPFLRLDPISTTDPILRENSFFLEMKFTIY